MTAHILIPSLDDERPATLSPRIIAMAKEGLNFQGIVATDDLEMKAISGKYGLPHAAVSAIAAGCDVVLLCGADQGAQVAALEAVIHAVEDGVLPLRRVEDALARHRRVKERFLAPPRSMPLTGAALRTLLGREEHQAIAAEMARFA
jgi:beta-N-acetylhexosaminidase